MHPALLQEGVCVSGAQVETGRSPFGKMRTPVSKRVVREYTRAHSWDKVKYVAIFTPPQFLSHLIHIPSMGAQITPDCEGWKVKVILLLHVGT